MENLHADSTAAEAQPAEEDVANAIKEFQGAAAELTEVKLDLANQAVDTFKSDVQSISGDSTPKEPTSTVVDAAVNFRETIASLYGIACD